jgi:hypothetical protein
MKTMVAAVLALTLAVPFVARAQTHPDFSGTWTLDEAKSDPAPAGRGGGRGRGAGLGAGAGGPVVITQTASDITIGGNTYKFDGSETTITGGRGGEARAKASWDAARLVITTSRDARGMSIATWEVRSLSADGKVMTVETTLTGPQGGTGSRKTIFNKS